MTQTVEIPLGAVLKLGQLHQVMEFVKDRNTDGLRDYLASIESDLVQHDVHYGYLYYQLCWKFKLLRG